MHIQTKKCTSFALAMVITLVFCFGNIVFTSKTAMASGISSLGDSNGISSLDQNRKVDVWDFGGVTQDGELYKNNISPTDLNECPNIAVGGLFNTANTSFGDLTLSHWAKDRLYAPLTTKNYGSNGLATKLYDDGYKANGMYYCNGTGGLTYRYFTISNVVAGDKIVAYMASSSAATDDLCFLYLGTDGNQLDKSSFTNVSKKYEFVAKYSGTYKLYTTTAGLGKPIYNRIMRIPGVKVSGSVNLNGNNISAYNVIFSNKTTGMETQANLNDNNFTALLAPGYSYTATLKGATGFGFTNDSKIVSPQLADVSVGLSGVVLNVEAKSTYSYTGKIVGFSSSYDISKLAINLEADKETLASDVALKINSDLSFSATLDPDITYTLKLLGVNDYEITSSATINNNQDVSADIKVALKPTYSVTGGYIDLPASKTLTSISFVNLDDSYTYQGQATATGYSAQLRNGPYSVTATVDGYKTSTHVVVKDGVVSKDLMFVPTDTTIIPITRVPDVYVGYSNKQNNYATVTAALNACKAMNPTSEAERITIHIAPGTYREQITVSTPYISFVNDEKEDVLLTWYYGIGYKYYSSDASGFYNPENAYDKFDKKIVQRWGASTRILDSATGFKAKNIVFETSFNRYITDEELEDGVEISGGEAITFKRKYGADVSSKASTERAAAIAIESDNVEFNNCSFLGSQDTMYIGGITYNRYFKNCFIEGNTDFIFGEGDAVFDACNISWKGYSDKDKEYQGYLTAARDSTNGFLFRNCIVTGNSDLTVGGGYFGRPWGKDANVKFINTKLESAKMIADAGWFDMSGNLPQNARFGEYNTIVADGTSHDTSKRVVSVMSQANANSINVANYFGTGWMPNYYVIEDTPVAFKVNPSLTDNGDINAPYPGHTLTVHYSLGDANDKNNASIIRWYRIGEDNKETLIKSSTAVASNTYKITAADQKCHLKVVVIPETISGKTGTQQSYTMDAFVREGYEDPTSGGSGIDLGDGINIFLAGDSTVKDYSAAGMYMSGKAQSEGSWGEFLQTFFDKTKVAVQNYANGGRSTRSFINEGSLKKISDNIGSGDYLFIQFGHNDCANGSGYLVDRYVPVGEPDANGVYPTTAGKKSATPASYIANYGAEYYSYDCGGTLKWYLQQYIDAAKSKGAIPVLVTPVARMNYNADGTIKPHHDSTDTTTGTYVSSNNAYVQAVKQLASEQNVLLIDAYDLTKKLYEASYKADTSASNGVSNISNQVMSAGDKTHSNKLGGFISSELMSQSIQNLNINISSYVNMPSQIAGDAPNGQQVFTVNGSNKLTAYAIDSESNYSISATYWNSIGQKLINEIGEKANELNNPTTAPAVWVVGDSTVSAFSDAYYYPRYGWGTQIYNYLDSACKVNNLALSGRSSKSYILDPEYTTLKNGMKSGDTLLIGFGHNDEKAEEGRYTNPNGTYKDSGTFAYSLYENYIKPAQAAGVNVVLCTPIVRRTDTGSWSNSNLHITTTVGDYAGGDYAQAIRDLGSTLNIPVVDMTTLTKNLYDKLGAAETVNLHSWTSSKSASVDNTHTNIWGAKYNAYLITQTIKSLNAPLAKYIITASAAPAKADTLVSNPDYKEPTYSSDLPNSALWQDIGIWKGTVFGNLGGTPSKSNFKLEEVDGKMNIAVANNKGKISSTADGVAMYYYKVPAKSVFTLTAKAKLNSFDSNDQVSFGLMARDEMYIDSNITTAIGDYVAAGLLKLTKSGDVWNCFARKSGVLTQGGTCANTYSADDTVALKIESNSDGYACTFGNEQTITGGFDFKLTSIDPDYVYVGMYAARNADITFSDIKLIVDGAEIISDNPNPPQEFSITSKVYTTIDDTAIINYLNTNKININKAILAEITGTGDVTKFVENTKVKVAIGTKYSGLKYDILYLDASTNTVKPLNNQVTVDSEGNVIITVPKLGKYLLTEVQSNDNDTGLKKYALEGYAQSANVTGGGELAETSSSYYKVSTADAFLAALTAVKGNAAKPSIIEITSDIALGSKEIGDALTKYSTVIKEASNKPLLHPTLLKTGVSKLSLASMKNLTIFSSNGSTIKHTCIDINGSSNVIIRNLAFDEIWEWDEDTKGDYDRNDWDYMTIQNGSTSIWVDHCTFYKAYDGIIDVKNALKNEKSNVTISWCSFLPGSKGQFFNEMMNLLESNSATYSYYSHLKNDLGMTNEQIRDYAYLQKKTHLVGASDTEPNMSNLTLTLANNYYYSTMDRLPRMRTGNAHVYNCIMDGSEIYKLKMSLANEEAKAKVVSNGAISTCGASVLVENSYYNGIINALLSGNSKSPYGKIDAINCLYFIGGVPSKLTITDTFSEGTDKITLDANSFKASLPYSAYNLCPAKDLNSYVEPYVGAGKVNMSTTQWMRTVYMDSTPIDPGKDSDLGNNNDSSENGSSGGKIGGGANSPVSISEAVENISTAPKGSVTVVNMTTNEPAVSTTLFEDIMGKDTGVQLNFGSFIWNFNGKDIKYLPGDRAFYNMGAQQITQKNISDAAGSSEVIQLELAHNGLFPCAMNLTFNIGSSLSGKSVYLNYFNEKTGKLEPASSGTVDQYGNVTFTLPHASKYVVTTDNVAGLKTDDKQPTNESAANGGKANIKTGAPLMPLETQAIIENPTPYTKSVVPGHDDASGNDIRKTKQGNNNITVIIILAILLAATAGGYLFIRYRRQN